MSPQSTPQNNPRPADKAVAHSETKLSGFRLISQGQVKLWKAMLVSLFLAGFVGALAFVAGNNQARERFGEGSKAAVLPASSVQYLGSTGSGTAKANSIKVSRIPGNANSPQLYITSLAVRAGVPYVSSDSSGSNSGILPRKLVESVEGGGLKWQEQITKCAGNGSQEVSLWTAYGPAQQDQFTVTARFSQVVPMATMAVSRYKGVDPSNPIANPAGANTNFDGSCAKGVPNANPALTTDAPIPGSVRFVATGSQASEIRGSVKDYLYRYLVRSKSGRDRMHLYLYDFSDPGAGKNEFKAQLSSAADWATAGMIIQPVPDAFMVIPEQPDFAVDFNPPTTGTVSIPVTISATLANIGLGQGKTSFYFTIAGKVQGTNIDTAYQLPGCAWENITLMPKEKRLMSCVWIPERATGEKITAHALPVGREDIKNNFVERIITIAPFVGARVYENFERYPVLGDPDGWIDTKSGNSLVQDDSLFKVVPVADSMTFATMSDTDAGGIHSHYVKGDSSRWSNYTYTGRMFYNQLYSGIGVTFYSQYPTENKYYTLFGSGLVAPPGPYGPFMSLNAVGTALSGDTVLEIGPLVNTWYRFKVTIVSDKVRTTIRAKVWKDGEAEPSGWQADAYDQSPSRLTQGTVGVSKGFPRGGKWDQLMVTDNQGVIVPFSSDASGGAR